MRTTIATLIIALFAFTGANVAEAQTAKTAKVVIIDFMEIQRTSLAGKDLMRQAENYRAELEAEQQRIQQDIRSTEAELSRQRDILTEDALQEKARAEQQRLSIAERDFRDKNNRIQIAARRAEQELQSKLAPIYQGIMSSHGANIIMDRSQMILSGSGMDVTREVIEKLDIAMPSIKLVVPESATDVE